MRPSSADERLVISEDVQEFSFEKVGREKKSNKMFINVNPIAVDTFYLMPFPTEKRLVNQKEILHSFEKQ